MPPAAVLAPPPAAIKRTLRVARRRLATQLLVEFICVAVVAGAGGWLAFCVFQRLTGGKFIVAGWAGDAFITALLLVPVLRRRWPTLASAAQCLDARAGTRDRFQTALSFAAQPRRAPLEELALEECARYAENFSVRPWTPIRMPTRVSRAAGAVVLGWAVFAVCLWAFAPHPRPRTALDAAVDERAKALEALAAKLRDAEAQKKTPELDKIAEEMKRAAERLKQTDVPADQKRKDALAELSALEAMLKALKDAQKGAQASPAELAALAAALAAQDQTKAAAAALKAGDLAEAAAQLEKLLQQMKEKGDAGQMMQQLAKSMQEQAAKLTEAQKSEVARQMQQAAQGAQGGQPQLSQQALQRLAELLRRAGQQGAPRDGKQSGGQGAGRPMTEKELQELLTALENMKDGLRPGDGSGKPGGPSVPGAGQRSLASVESFGDKPGGDGGDGDKASGQPGGEHDTGRHDQAGDKGAAGPKPAGPASRLEGLLGEGESLQELIQSTDGPARSNRGYRALYEAAAPAAQEAVEQENIPLGSRPFIRRYFENIRPPE